MYFLHRIPALNNFFYVHFERDQAVRVFGNNRCVSLVVREKEEETVGVKMATTLAAVVA